jgi:hypothetical protein
MIIVNLISNIVREKLNKILILQRVTNNRVVY